MAAVLLAVTLIAGCGRHPALHPETLQVRTVAVDPAPRDLAAPARERAIARWTAVATWNAVTRWTFAQSIRMAVAVDGNLKSQPRSFSLPRPNASPVEGRWQALSMCESSGNWSANTGNGYEGGLQFSNATWLAYGGGRYAQHAYDATPGEQIAVAERVLASQGPSAWPVCSYRAGLR